jgi:hypothetical protein
MSPAQYFTYRDETRVFQQIHRRHVRGIPVSRYGARRRGDRVAPVRSQPYASRLKAQPDDLIKIFEPSEIHIVVAGGETQGAWTMISGSLRATVSIDAWR